MVRSDEYKRVITVNNDLYDSQHCLLNNTLLCSSFHYVLTHLQSGDYVNVTSNSVSLLTVVELQNVNNITIRGQGNTIVMCNNTGVVSCNNCSNIVIEGIIWDQCGDLQRRDLYGGINFHTISNLTVQNCTFQHSKLRALSIYAPSGFIYMINSQMLYNANSAPITCGLVARTGFIHCATKNYVATGGMLIKEAINSTVIMIHIKHCVFNYNGHFGKVIDIEYMELPSGYDEIADGAGLLIETLKSSANVSIVIEHTNFYNNRGRSGAGTRLYIKNSPNKIILKKLNYYNNSGVRYYVSASALTIRLRRPKVIAQTSLKQIQLFLLHCAFYNNYGARNTIDYFNDDIVQSNVTIKHCILANNSGFIVELNLQSQSLISIVGLNFSNNIGSRAMIYIQVRFYSIMISMSNINIQGNYGYSANRRVGFIYLLIEKDNSTVKLSSLNFSNNQFTNNDGGIYISGTFQKTSQFYIQNSYFANNVGYGSGTAIYSSLTSTSAYMYTYMIAIENCTFIHNKGKSIVYVAMVYYRSPAFLVLNGEFNNNFGTPLELFNIILVGNGNTSFHDNKADTGAALHISNSFLLLNFFSFQFKIINNFANTYGGAIFIDYLFSNVNRTHCHWLLYSHDDFCRDTLYYIHNCNVIIKTNIFCSNFLNVQLATSNIFLFNNTALLAGSAVFYNNVQNIHPLRRSPSLLDPFSIFHLPKIFTIIPNITEPLVLATQPQRLQLSDPAECNNHYTACNITGITLGEEIRIKASIIGYNNRPSEATRFFIELMCAENCMDFDVCGGPIILINHRLAGISIIGKRIKYSTSVILRLYTGTIDLYLSVVLFPCQLGYTYNERTRRCYCYNIDSIILCVTNTTIKKDYWFGVIGEQSTVSLCPNKYCNFSRTESTSAKYILYPFYDDQCGLHRTGQACGSCKNGYTLAFDFHDCVNINSCSTGITAVIVMCVIFYWILVIITILWLMYFQINVGYLYGIIYYYSVVDILLGHILNYSSSFDVLVIVISSVVKLSPRFLGKLCFLQGGMSGIDQYALHYIHPTGILLILFILSVVARHSRRFALFISRGAIRSICFILILAYTSIADTSLQLLRHLKFTDINELYTYWSPDVKYFTGRHIIYVIIAILFELVMVVGLPVILLFEPYVNRWINFTRIKPILDQFQGCYRDKCRWFAGVYLLSRQVILIIMVINFANNYIALYLLTLLCVIISLLHHHVQPYKCSALNKFDGCILHLLVLVVSLQMVAVGNSIGFTSDAIIGISYALIFVPIVMCIAALLYFRVHISCGVDYYKFTVF